jgi:hypothetical protein
MSIHQIRFLNERFINCKHVSFDDFCELDTAEELHYIGKYLTHNSAHRHDHSELLYWIVSSKTCSISTALLIYWRIAPAFLNCFESTHEAKWLGRYFEIAKLIEQRVLQNKYPNINIYFDPENDDGINRVAENFRPKESKSNIPLELRVSVMGNVFPNYEELYPDLFRHSHNDDNGNILELL